MTKATARPTIQTRYAIQARKDRRLAALERQEARLAGFTTEIEERRAMYTNTGR